MGRRLLLLCVILGVGVSTASAGARQTDDSDGSTYMYCSLADHVHSVMYYSDVFLVTAPVPEMSVIEDAFHDRVYKLYPEARGMGSCSVADSTYRGREAKEAAQRRQWKLYRSVIETGWRY